MGGFRVFGALRALVPAALLCVQANAGYDKYEMNLPELQSTLRVFAFDGKVTRILCSGSVGVFHGYTPETPSHWRLPSAYTNVSGLNVSAAAIKGSFTLTSPSAQRAGSGGKAFAIDATISGSKITGTYEAIGKKGSLQGEYVSENAMSQINAIGKGRDWPCFSGPNGNFTSPPPSSKLITELSRIRLRWISQDLTPHASAGKSETGERWDPMPCGGAASPVIADGRLYMWFHIPSGPSKNPCEAGRDNAPAQWDFIDADDVVLCIDAATGRTLWKKVYEKASMPWHPHKTDIQGCTPVVYMGKLFCVNGVGLLYCHDAATGNLLWKKPLPSGYIQSRKDAFRRCCSTTKRYNTQSVT